MGKESFLESLLGSSQAGEILKPCSSTEALEGCKDPQCEG